MVYIVVGMPEKICGRHALDGGNELLTYVAPTIRCIVTLLFGERRRYSP